MASLQLPALQLPLVPVTVMMLAELFATVRDCSELGHEEGRRMALDGGHHVESFLAWCPGLASSQLILTLTD